MKNNKKKIIIAVVLGIVFMIVFAIVAKSNFRNESADIDKDLGIPVNVSKIETGDIKQSRMYVGTIESQNSVIISSKLTSQILDIKVREGDDVVKGQLIATLDGSQFAAMQNTIAKKIEIQNVNLDYLLKEENTYKILYDEGAVSKNTYDQVILKKDVAILQLEEIKASLNELNTSIEDASILASASGKVRTLYYESGDLAIAGKPFVIIDDLGSIMIKVNISEHDLGEIKVGTKALLQITGAQDRIEETISKILPSINASTRIGEAEIQLTKEYDVNIFVGASVEVEIITSESHDVIKIPVTAIKRLQDKEFVYVIEDNLVIKTEVLTGISDEYYSQVIKGLKIGDMIVENNLNSMFDGAKIYALEEVKQ